MMGRMALEFKDSIATSIGYKSRALPYRPFPATPDPTYGQPMIVRWGDQVTKPSGQKDRHSRAALPRQRASTPNQRPEAARSLSVIVPSNSRDP